MATAATTVSHLLNALAVSGATKSAALRGALGVSAPTLTRLVDSAGEDVFRIGRGPATQYARTRTLEGLGRSLPVFRVGDNGIPSPAGTLHLLWGWQTYWAQSDVGRLFEGLPPALADMAPQGYLGRSFADRHPELRLPRRLTDWSDNHRLVALARRGEDCVGNLIAGDESLQRFLNYSPVDVPPEQFPVRAGDAAAEAIGSSAGGERPKFGVFSRGRHVLVKFAQSASADGAARRWRDLLWCEWKALETVAAAGRAAPKARCIDIDGWRFLETERFDRVGERGRRAVLSLMALNNEYLGNATTWTLAASQLQKPPFRLPERDASDLRWLDVFGQLIGNNDRHLGNVSFFVAADNSLRLAPTYDMLPMALAPSAEVVVSRRPDPEPPTGSTLDIWFDAASAARQYWSEVGSNGDLHEDVRRYAEEAMAAISSIRERVAPKASWTGSAT
jgi:hypothetical protein